MKHFLFTLLSFILLSISYSCSESDPVHIYGNIAGKVTEEGSNKAIEGVIIEISGIEQSVKTGSNGMFKFENLPADNYTIYATKDGYVADSKVISVVATQTAQCDFSLSKNLPVATPSEVILTSNYSASIELTNTRSVDMDFTIETSQPWIAVNPNHGTIASKNKKIINVIVDCSKIEYGEYTESVIINVGESSLSIPVQISYQKPAYIEVTSPEAGKAYTMGNVLPIKWNSNVGGTVKIELYRNGYVQQSIVYSVDNYTTSEHSWGIPSLSVDAYQIRVTSNESPNVYGTSAIFYLQEGPTPPVVSTGEVTSITSSSITILGAIEDFGKTYNNVTQYGHVFSEMNPNPTISDSKFNHGGSNELTTYSTELKNLKPNTTYYIRAYAENPKGIAYGTTTSVTTQTVDGKEPWTLTEPDETGAVDLGLSVKWAAYNVGAEIPEEYGNYYAWGEVETKVEYLESNYQFAYIDNYGDYNYILPDDLTEISGTIYDAATVVLGENWRMPTKLEFMELLEKATHVRTTYNGVEGMRIIGPNGNSIFLPLSGYRCEYGLREKGQGCAYMSGTTDQNTRYNTSTYVYTWGKSVLGNVYNGISSWYKYQGFTIRPVRIY